MCKICENKFQFQQNFYINIPWYVVKYLYIWIYIMFVDLAKDYFYVNFIMIY